MDGAVPPNANPVAAAGAVAAAAGVAVPKVVVELAPQVTIVKNYYLSD